MYEFRSAEIHYETFLREKLPNLGLKETSIVRGFLDLEERFMKDFSNRKIKKIFYEKIFC